MHKQLYLIIGGTLLSMNLPARNSANLIPQFSGSREQE